MNARCIKFFLRGVLELKPLPDHDDFRCWLKGNICGVGAIVMICLVIPLAVAFLLGTADFTIKPWGCG